MGKQEYILTHLKANGEYYYPRKKGIKNPSLKWGDYPYCIIEKLWFGRWKITRWNDSLYDKGEQIIIVYPSGIEEIKYNAKYIKI